MKDRDRTKGRKVMILAWDIVCDLRSFRLALTSCL